MIFRLKIISLLVAKKLYSSKWQFNTKDLLADLPNSKNPGHRLAISVYLNFIPKGRKRE